MKPIDDKGFLIPVIENNDVDYLACARALAKSIKYWHPEEKVCLLTDADYNDTDNIFDYVKKFKYPIDYENPFANDWQVFYCSPFHETIKLESDIVLTGTIDHWWSGLRHKDVVIPLGCKNFYGEYSSERFYRRMFDHNNLPDVYNAITYWRISKTAKTFFSQVRHIFENWQSYYKITTGIDADLVPDTDLVYAIATMIIGQNHLTLPQTEFPCFVHMKGKHNGFPGESWTRHLVWELDAGNLRINTIAQSCPVHYHEKSFAHKIENHYDKLLAST